MWATGSLEGRASEEWRVMGTPSTGVPKPSFIVRGMVEAGPRRAARDVVRRIPSARAGAEG